VLHPEDELADLQEDVVQDMKGVLGDVDKSGEGVYVQASTLGSLEALLAFLRDPRVNIPVAGINIGPVHKRDVMGASVMLEHKRKEYATILAFDVKVEPAASELAAEMGIKIFTADIIYHLFDQFTAYIETVKEEKKKEASDSISFPCVLKIMPGCVFNKKDPIVLGVEVVSGIARVGTVICVPSQGYIDLGRIASLEHNHKAVEKATRGQTVAMKIQSQIALEGTRMYGRHFDSNDELISRVTRRSIDLLKEHFRDELGKEGARCARCAAPRRADSVLRLGSACEAEEGAGAALWRGPLIARACKQHCSSADCLSLFYSSLRWQGAQHRCIFPQSSRQVHLQMLQQSAS